MWVLSAVSEIFYSSPRFTSIVIQCICHSILCSQPNSIWNAKIGQRWTWMESFRCCQLRICDSHINKAGILSGWVFHLLHCLSNALQMTQWVLQYAIILGTGTMRCHWDDWQNVAVDVVDVMIIDENVIICRVSGWSGYGDRVVDRIVVVVIASVEVAIWSATAGWRSIMFVSSRH